MKISYFPGCTLKTQAKNFEISALSSLSFLGVEMVELSRWNCCGTVYSLSSDDLIHQVAPVRNLIRVKEMGEERVVTLCSMCYHTLKRANKLVRKDEEKLQKLNDFMYLEKVKYDGSVEVYHLLEFLRDEIGFSKISKEVKRPLRGLKLAPYYGCLLLRPDEVAIDDPEMPTVLTDFLTSLGGESVDYPYATECCGAYHTTFTSEIVIERAHHIITSAVERGAEGIVLSCPLCSFNLDERQKDVKEMYPEFKSIPVFYFTQLLSFSLGLDIEKCGFEFNFINPYPLLREKGLINE